MKRTLFFCLVIISLVGCGQEREIKISSSSHTTAQKESTIDAIYIGLIDNHSIEVMFKDQPLVLQITEEQKNKLELFETNKPLKIVFVHNPDTMQNILLKFQEK